MPSQLASESLSFDVFVQIGYTPFEIHYPLLLRYYHQLEIYGIAYQNIYATAEPCALTSNNQTFPSLY